MRKVDNRKKNGVGTGEKKKKKIMMQISPLMSLPVDHLNAD